MSEAVDLAALAARGVNHVTLARGVVGESGHGTDYTGWSDASSVFVSAKAGVRDQSRGVPGIVLTVEGSSNGSVWSTLATFTFGQDGEGSASVSSPPDHLRASWAITGGSEWMIFYVNASASVVDSPGGGGGSQPVGCVLATDSELTSGSVNLDWSFLFDNAYDTNPLMALPDGIGFTTMFDGSDGTITITANGWYAFTLSAAVDQDATWAGWLALSIGQAIQNFSEVAVGAGLATCPFVGYLPAGASFSAQIGQLVAPTGNPTCAGTLVCARLA